MSSAGPAGASSILSRGRSLAWLPLAVLAVWLLPGRLSSFGVFMATLIAVYALVAMGLNVVQGYAGVVSAGQGALVALGAYVSGLLIVDAGWPFWVAVPLATMVATAGGALMVLPAFRISAWYFAMITLMMAVVVEVLLLHFNDITHGYSGVVGIPHPEIAGRPLSDQEFFWLVAGSCILTYAVIKNLVRSRAGRALTAVRDAPITAQTSGISVGAARIGAFSFAALIAGLGGAYFGALKGVITPDDFTIELSIFFLVVVTLGGQGTLVGPLVGVLAFVWVPEVLHQLQAYRFFFYGAALLFVMVYFPEGLTGAARRVTDRLRPQADDQGIALDVRAEVPEDIDASERTSGAPLDVVDVTKRFGGVTALEGVSVAVEAGAVHGIVGPNGSGKTTLLNIVSRLYTLDTGTVLLDGQPVQRWQPRAVARGGVGRTFQTPQVVHDLTVIDNVKLGQYHREETTILGAALRTPRYLRRTKFLEQHAEAWLRFVGLADSRNRLAALLPHGQLRFVEFARAMVASPRVLLLDEPAAGLSAAELDHLARLITAVCEHGVTVVLVEHRMDLIRAVAGNVTVLDRGRVLAEGPTNEVLSDQRVIEAYLGQSAQSAVGP